ncbi:MAG: hypothetical protein A3A98_03120 [Candidatus Staskawiczbacteria bacterium RIFCSPLOWO2_01_FULL_40_39]|uniref:Uncharacterized protein n=1 Tax=Candidatus Staskawiczbacteria bacterium RIFCSPHIGHO2_01_FULL_39_25 TaxID=1802202 RepID=A0A1G2HPX7_9BACT|nr:MAG: hypothetical protein A2730_01420 [Candidatus Staskawiczbacteria bacterium RIFCSPHIGHO2_01_FULL_39_25]OGZ73014.1 MAG: hypothetical protein A3A98_03120 [Candidatus Staskawiczbacteria bacterium RIFCSPLOWO2_01_FULL_40_39]OGZ76240.1 MAG: hypothetical protein A3I87_02165 [Candidatus Staskawiczbacteria bacterium RIFCSPLOWO2_02_FULL_39_8]
MSYFFWGTIFLLGATVIFYLVFLSLVYYWHERKTSFVIVPLLYTFEFFLIGFLVVSLISLVLQYLPDIVTLVRSAS